MANEPAPIRVPEDHLDAFRFLEAQSEEEFGALIEELTSVQFPTSYFDIVTSVAKSTNLRADTWSDVVDALVGLCSYGTQQGDLPETLARRVTATDQIIDDPERKAVLTQRLQALLSSRAIRLLSKTSLIAGCHPNVFRDVQVLTDVRPMFALDVEAEPDPEGALLTHTLRIRYVTSKGDLDTFYVAMDDINLGSLMEAIERAALKSKSLQDTLATFGIPQVLAE